MEQPIVKVKDISNLLGEDLPLDKEVNLGDPKADERINALLVGKREL